MNPGRIRQILLITDGCSNAGEDPIAMAALAKEPSWAMVAKIAQASKSGKRRIFLP